MSSAEYGTIGRQGAIRLGALPGWLLLGFVVYALLLINGGLLLGDSDTYWHVAVGKWILDHGAVPHTDIYSFTKTGEPWISSSWLAQVLYAAAYEWSGWAGPIVLASAAIAATAALLARSLGARIGGSYAIAIACAALVLAASHFFARPHVLVMPVMVAWAAGLLQASERGAAPSWWLLPLLVLWANLHGSFVFGLTLVAPFALDAMWNAERPSRWRLALRWALFGAAALAACCATPYGWDSILASRRILDLGELLHLIYEWMPVDFGRFGAFEGSLLVALAAALYYGVRLPAPRIVLLLGLLHMALSHVRNVEIFAMLAPLAVVAPVAAQFVLQPAQSVRTAFPVASAVLLALLAGAATWAFAATHPFTPPANQAPAAALDVLRAHHATRILNDLPFAGYFIAQGVPVFIDGRAELYGEAFVMAYYRAMQLKDVNALLDLLKTHDIDAVVLTPATPAVSFMDHAAGWQRIYADDNAVVHLRAGQR